MAAGWTPRQTRAIREAQAARTRDVDSGEAEMRAYWKARRDEQARLNRSRGVPSLQRLKATGQTYFGKPDLPENYASMRTRGNRSAAPSAPRARPAGSRIGTAPGVVASSEHATPRARATPMGRGSSVFLGGYKFHSGTSPARPAPKPVRKPDGTWEKHGYSSRDVVENSSRENVIGVADQIGRNNARRYNGIQMLRKMGMDEGTLKQLWKSYAADPGAAGWSKEDTKTIHEFLKGRFASHKTRVDEFGKIGSGVSSSLYGTKLPTEREGVIAELESRGRGRLKGVGAEWRDVRGSLRDDALAYAGAAAAGAASASGRGRGGRGGYGPSAGVSRASFVSDIAGADGKITGRERGSSISSGGGWDSSGFVSMGGGASAAAGSTFRSVMQTADRMDRGGRVVAVGPSGEPIFGRSYYGGFSQTSDVAKDYNRAASNLASARTRLYNNWLMSPEGKTYMAEKRIQDMYANERDRASRAIRREYNGLMEAADYFGYRPETQPAQVQKTAQVQETAAPSQVAAVPPSAPSSPTVLLPVDSQAIDDDNHSFA